MITWHSSHFAPGPGACACPDVDLFPQMPWPWLLHGSVALSHALILWLILHRSPPTHASFCIYISLSLFLSSVLSCFILSYPANLMSLLSLPLSSAHCLPLPPADLSPNHPPFFSFSLFSAVEVSYDAAPESLPMFNYINKTSCEVEWPRTYLYAPLHPSPFISLPSLLMLLLPADPVKLLPGYISWQIASHVFLSLRHWFRPNLQRLSTCSLHSRSCQRFLPPSLTCCRWKCRGVCSDWVGPLF